MTNPARVDLCGCPRCGYIGLEYYCPKCRQLGFTVLMKSANKLKRQLETMRRDAVIIKQVITELESED